MGKNVGKSVLLLRSNSGNQSWTTSLVSKQRPKSESLVTSAPTESMFFSGLTGDEGVGLDDFEGAGAAEEALAFKENSGVKEKAALVRSGSPGFCGYPEGHAVQNNGCPASRLFVPRQIAYQVRFGGRERGSIHAEDVMEPDRRFIRVMLHP